MTLPECKHSSAHTVRAQTFQDGIFVSCIHYELCDVLHCGAHLNERRCDTPNECMKEQGGVSFSWRHDSAYPRLKEPVVISPFQWLD